MRKLATISVLFLAFAAGEIQEVQAQFGPFSDGSLDPFNRNNKLPIFIPPIRMQRRENNDSQLYVQSYELDQEGNFWEVSPYGRKEHLGKGVLLKDSSTGRRFWRYVHEGRPYTTWASDRYQYQEPTKGFRLSDGGRFVRSGDTTWKEYDRAGRHTYTFRQMRISGDFILLFDQTRSMWLAMPRSGRTAHIRINGRWQPWQEVTWR